MTIEELKEIVQRIASKFHPGVLVVSEVWDYGPTSVSWVFAIYWHGHAQGERTSIAVEVDQVMLAAAEDGRAEVERQFGHSIERAFNKWKAGKA